MSDTRIGANEYVESREEAERLAAGVLMVGFPGEVVPADTTDLTVRGIRAFILFARNIGSSQQVRSLNADLRRLAGDDALIAIDHEGGRVNRLDAISTPWPSPMAWAATGDPDLARRASAASGAELRDLGINLNFAPVVDLLGNHHNPVLGTRCFSDDPETAAIYASAFVEGHHDAGVASTAKHFPGHGGTSVDSHVDMPEVAHTLEELQRGDLVPFEAAIAAGVDCLMVSHIWYSGLDDRPTPASVSRRVMDLARNDLGYDGLIVTDCMEMGAIQNEMGTGEAVVQAIRSGADLAIVSHQVDLQRQALDALTEAVLDGSLPLGRIKEAHHRLHDLRARLQDDSAARGEDGADLARTIAQRAVTLVRDNDRVLPLQLSPDDALGVVTFLRHRPSAVENPRSEPSSLAEAARKQHPTVVEVKVPAGSEPESVLEPLRHTSVILVGTDFTTGHALQADVVDTLLKAGKRTIVLALNDPFDLLSFPSAPCYLAAFGNSPIELDAALAVLFGHAEAPGRLPVALGDLYPRGHGLMSVKG